MVNHCKAELKQPQTSVERERQLRMSVGGYLAPEYLDVFVDNVDKIASILTKELGILRDSLSRLKLNAFTDCKDQVTFSRTVDKVEGITKPLTDMCSALRLIHYLRAHNCNMADLDRVESVMESFFESARQSTTDYLMSWAIEEMAYIRREEEAAANGESDA